MNKAVFIDRDGTINVDIGYAYKPSDCVLIEDGIPVVLRKLRDAGYLLIIVTNQAGIDKGIYTEKDFHIFMEDLQKRLGIQFDGIYFCPYHPKFSGEHEWRKPNNGMIMQAQKDFQIDLSQSYMIGDNEKDIIAGTKSGCLNILINSQNQDVQSFGVKPDYVVTTWKEIDEIILK